MNCSFLLRKYLRAICLSLLAAFFVNGSIILACVKSCRYHVVDTRIFGMLNIYHVKEIFIMDYKMDANNLLTPEEIQAVEE